MDNEMIVLKWLFPVFLAALAVVHLISCWRGDDDLRKPTKVALMPVVALTYLAFANTPSLWVVAGLLFGCLGDLFLLRPLQKHFFALGTASFFLGHVCYLVHIYTTYAVHVRWFWIVLVCAAYAAGIVVVYKGSRKEHPARPASAGAGVHGHALHAEHQRVPAAGDGVHVGQARGVSRRVVLPRVRRRAVRHALHQEGRADQAELCRHGHVHPCAGAADHGLCILSRRKSSKKTGRSGRECPVFCTVVENNLKTVRTALHLSEKAIQSVASPMVSRGEESIMKANERDSRTEQERFIDRMLKEILGGQRNPGDRLPTESELAAQYDLRKTNVHLALKELERLGFLEIVPRHATYVAPYWERANLETLAVIMTHGVTPHPELVDAFMELREMVALGWFCWVGRRPDAAQMQKAVRSARADGRHRLRARRRQGGVSGTAQCVSGVHVPRVGQHDLSRHAALDARACTRGVLHGGLHARYAGAVQGLPRGA